MAATMNSATLMGRNFQDNLNSIVITTDLVLKKMFDISAKLVEELDEISGLETIVGKNIQVTKQSSIFNARKSTSFQILCCVLEGSIRTRNLIKHGNKEEDGLPLLKATETLTESMESRLNSSGTSSQDSIRCSSVVVKDLLSRLGETPENFTGRILFMSMFNDISCVTKNNEKECLARAKIVSLCARRFGKGQWSFIGPGSEKKWYSMKEDSPQGIWDNIAEKMLLEFAESGCPIFRATTPLSRGQLKSNGHGKLSIHFAATQETMETIFRIIVSANQRSLHGAVADMIEEYESLHDRSGRPDMVMGQSIVLSAIKTEVPLDCDDPTNQDLLLQQYGERIEKLSQQDKLSKFCMDAGLLNVVEIGQYFMTKDTEDLTQFHAVACREYTLPRDDGSSQPRGWIQ